MVLAPAIHKLLGVPSAARWYLKEITNSTNFMPNDTLAHLESKGVRRFSIAYFLGILVLMIFASPFIGNSRGGAIIESVLETLVLLSAVLAVGVRLKMLIGLILAVPALLGDWLSYLLPHLPFPELFRTFGLVFLWFVVVQFLRYIVRAPRVDFEVLCAGVAIYLLLGLLWSFAYVLLDHRVPDSFVYPIGPPVHHSMEGFNALYFSFITLSTVGFGDIVPVSSMGRMLAITEAVFGTFYLTLMIARLVSLYTGRGSPDAVSRGRKVARRIGIRRL
jgi:hypothetical protein